MKRILITLGIFLIFTSITFAQNINLDEYEIYVFDTLIAKSDFIKNSQSLSPKKAETIEFKPITDGIKTYYYLNGKIQGKGEIKSGKGEQRGGLWS